MSEAETILLPSSVNGDLKLEEKQKELDQVLKERDDFKVKLEKWTNASVLQNEVLNKQRYLSDKSCIGFGVESSSGMESDNSSGDETLTDPLYENFKREKATKQYLHPQVQLFHLGQMVSFTGIDELAIRNKVNNQEKIKSSQPEIDRNKVIIEDWVDSDDEETVLNSSETQKKTVLNSENSETSFKNRSPSSQNSVGQGSRKKGLGNNGGTARPRVPQAVLSRSTGRPYYPRMDNRRPSISSYSPSSRSSTTRAPHRPQRPKKIVKLIWVKKGSTVESQAVLPQNVSIKRSAMITSKQTWRQNKGYLDSVNRMMDLTYLSNFEAIKRGSQGFNTLLIESGCSGSMTGDKNKLTDFKDNKG
ncbi:hypothetical protein Tco_0819039 [Tanacetum coccineum]|uniref:Uncharacterized protein n=1 Tax=Tanacetum coccineum TaxID=301880 RepID=A0ABQ5A5E4_9ASTR